MDLNVNLCKRALMFSDYENSLKRTKAIINIPSYCVLLVSRFVALVSISIDLKRS